MASKPITEVPFKPANDRSGPSYLNYGSGYTTMKSVPEKFDLLVKIVDWERGRSAVTVFVEDELGVRFPMFMKDFMDLVTNVEPDDLATYSGIWKFVKRGANYGLSWVDKS